MKVQIALNKDIDKAREIIYNYFSNKKVKLEEKAYQTRHVFNISPVKNRAVKNFYDDITNLILDLILNIYSSDFIYKRIGINFKNLNPKEKKQVGKISEKILLNENNFIAEKEYMNEEIKKYIMDMPFISIDGFILFRLKGFNLLIDLVVDKGIEEFTLEKEYKEFINILRYFVEVQGEKSDLVNIIFKSGYYRLYDRDNKKIDNNFFEEVISELEDTNIGDDDILISSLIVLSPKNIIIHLNDEKKYDDVLKIISDVFQEKVFYCYGCEMCNKRVRIERDS